MRDEHSPSTHITLLRRLRAEPTDQAAWHDFVERYGPLIYHWCRRWQLQEADARDVTQVILLKLARELRAFEYDPGRRFRGWLHTLTHHALSDFLASPRRAFPAAGDPGMLEALASLEARADLVQKLEEEFDREILEIACAQVRQRVQPHTWDAFRLTALEGLSGADAAARLGLKVDAVFMARSRVQKMLQETIQDLEKA